MPQDGEIALAARLRVNSNAPGHPGVVSRRDNGVVTKILCKGCGDEIAGMRNREFTRHSMYEEVKFEFDDRSAHVSHCCLDCREILMGPMPQEARLKTLELWYCIDMIDWIHSIETTGKGSISKRDAIRIPTGIGA